MTDEPSRPRRTRETLGLILCRLVVPGWILLGAGFKLVEATPKLLPKQILVDADRMSINLDVLLASLISIEFVIAFAIFFVRPLARVAAMSMMSVFVIVLIREIAAGSTSCGCLGAASPSPWLMLGIDGAILLGLIVLRPGPMPRLDDARWPFAVAAVLSLVGAGTSFVKLVPWSNGAGPPPPPVVVDNDETPAIELPSYWFETDFDAWVGRRWDEIDLLRFMEKKPSGLDAGVRYVVFYSRSCEHCEAMFNEDLAPDPTLARQVTAVEVPTDKKSLRAPNAWKMPDNECELLALPIGPDWIMESPIALRIEDGIVRCAEEGDHRACLGLPAE